MNPIELADDLERLFKLSATAGVAHKCADNIKLIIKSLRSALPESANNPSREELISSVGHLLAGHSFALIHGGHHEEVASKTVDLVRARLAAKPAEDGVLLPLIPAARQLKQFGFAPGTYQSKCFGCDAIKDGLDKRATSCRECAERRYVMFVRECALNPPTTGQSE